MGMCEEMTNVLAGPIDQDSHIWTESQTSMIEALAKRLIQLCENEDEAVKYAGSRITLILAEHGEPPELCSWCV